MSDARLALRVLVAATVVLGAVAAVLLLHGWVSNGADDYAWALALAHDKWWWGLIASLVSGATPSLGGGAALLLLAAVLSVRSRRWTPLVVAVAALVLLGIVVASGKLLLYQGGVAGDRGYRIPGPRWPSGPATTAVVVGGMSTLLLRDRVRWIRGFVGFAAVVVLLNGAAEVFLGQHRLGDVIASWATGLAIVAVVALAAGPRVRALPDGPLLPALVHLLARTPLAAPFHRAHVWLLLRSGGRIGGRWLDGSRVAVLEVPGRRTGRLRRVALVYVEHPDGLLVTPAAAGLDVEPDWLKNLRAAGAAVVHLRGTAVPVAVEEARGARRDDLWRFVVDRCPSAAEYARIAGRPLGVVVLRPTA